MIRKAVHKDIDAVLKLINLHAEKGQMLSRSRKDIKQNIESFLVIERTGELFATCSLKVGWDRLLEIRSLAVHPNYYRKGMGTTLVRECISKAMNMDVEKVFVLTYAIPLFAKLGFEVIEKGALPLKIWSDCHGCHKRGFCDETAMILDLHFLEKLGFQGSLSDAALCFK